MPTPAESPTPASAWEEIVRQISSVGTYGRPLFSDPTIAEAVTSIRWSAICRDSAAHRTLRRLLTQRLQPPKTAREEPNLRPPAPSPSPAPSNRETQTDLFGEKAKNAGIAAVAESHRAWVQRGLHGIEAMPLWTRLTGENVTETIGVPANFRAVGAVINLAFRRGLIRRTDALSRPRDPKKCGHLNLVWRRASATGAAREAV